MPPSTLSALRAAPAAATLAFVLVLAACTAPPVAPPNAATVTRTAAPLPGGTDGPLKTTRAYAWSVRMDEANRRLRAGLSGPPDVAVTTDQRIWVSLPTAASFARGRAALEPAARGWLDQVALALRGHPQAEVQIVATADAGQRGPNAETLALDRAASARDWLVARGIAAPRVGVAALASRAAAGSELRVDLLIGERTDLR
jgi:outer membrane protein OmpA-like peptidoglycan-associated protein